MSKVIRLARIVGTHTDYRLYIRICLCGGGVGVYIWDKLTFRTKRMESTKSLLQKIADGYHTDVLNNIYFLSRQRVIRRLESLRFFRFSCFKILEMSFGWSIYRLKTSPHINMIKIFKK